MSNLESQQNKTEVTSERDLSKPCEQTDTDDLQAIRQRTEKELQRAVDAEDSILLESPPSSGKTTATFKIISETDAPFTYLTKRKDLYEQAEELSNEYGASPTIIPSPHEDCPAFDEDSSQYNSEAEELYNLGVSAGDIHSQLNLTCSSNCDYSQFWQDFDADDHDVLVGHYKQAYIPSIVDDRIVIIDEFPGNAFQREFRDADEMIARFLKSDNWIPFNNWGDLIQYQYTDRREKVAEWFQWNGVEANPEAIIDTNKNDRYHTIAPFLVFSLLNGVEYDNGFGCPWFNLTDIEAGFERGSSPYDGLNNNRRVAVDYDTHEMYVLTQPNLSEARGVIGLDGTPTPELWELATGEDFDHRIMIERDEKMNAYISDGLGITIKQTNDHLKPYHSGRISENRDTAILYAVEIAKSQKPALIAPNKALDAYEGVGILDRAKTLMNYAEVLSSNDFEGEAVGVIMGCPHPGDDILKRWAAYFGAPIEGEGEGMAKTYGDFGDEIYQHFVHNQVLQAIFRFGRGKSEAVVYVNTAAIPDWLAIDAIATPDLFDSANKRAIADYLRNTDDGATKTEIMDATGASKTTVEDILYEFRNHDLVEVEEQDGPYPSVYRWSQ